MKKKFQINCAPSQRTLIFSIGLLVFNNMCCVSSVTDLCKFFRVIIENLSTWSSLPTSHFPVESAYSYFLLYSHISRHALRVYEHTWNPKWPTRMKKTLLPRQILSLPSIRWPEIWSMVRDKLNDIICFEYPN